MGQEGGVATGSQRWAGGGGGGGREGGVAMGSRRWAVTKRKNIHRNNECGRI